MAAERSRRTNAGRRYPSPSEYDYLRGNVVPKVDAVPDYDPEKKRKQVSRQVRKNRVKEAAITRGYMIFLTVASVAVVAICVLYLSLQSALITQNNAITKLQTQYSDLQEANDARYNNINDSVSLDDIRNKAMNELGMVYASPSQIITYENPDNDFIKQYSSIPDTATSGN